MKKFISDFYTFTRINENYGGQYEDIDQEVLEFFNPSDELYKSISEIVFNEMHDNMVEFVCAKLDMISNQDNYKGALSEYDMRHIFKVNLEEDDKGTSNIWIEQSEDYPENILDEMSDKIFRACEEDFESVEDAKKDLLYNINGAMISLGQSLSQAYSILGQRFFNDGTMNKMLKIEDFE